MITLDAAIAKLSAHSDIDKRGQDVLAAAITLRDSRGKDRQNALRQMTSTWDVHRQVKIEGKWRERPLPTIASELETKICLAAATWQPSLVGEGERAGGEHDDVAEHAPATSSTIAPEHDDGSEQRGVAQEGPATSSTMALTDDRSPSEAGPAKKARTTSVDSTQATVSSWLPSAGHECQILVLPKTQEDVVSVRRLGPDDFEATKMSGELWRGDAEMLETLPQGKAKLATLRDALAQTCWKMKEDKARAAHA